MFRQFILLLALCLLLPTIVYAKAAVVEGDDAKKAYEADKNKAQMLVQKDKNFILRSDGADTLKPDRFRVKVGERFYILNDEAEYVHNVYDQSDAGWVLKKQEPASMAAVSFDAP